LIGFLLLYAAMSAFCYWLSFDPVVHLDRDPLLGYLLWVYGPAMILVYGTQFLSTYVLATVIIVGLAVIIAYASGRSRVRAVFAWVFAVITWLFFAPGAYGVAA
jgi:hypothetical protein